MISKGFTDRYNTRTIVRIMDGHEHVQFLQNWPSGTYDPYSYGFHVDDFAEFARIVAEVAAELEQRTVRT